MKRSRRLEIVQHLTEAELERAIDEAQQADETRLVRRLCFVRNLYAGDTLAEAGRRVGVSQPTTSRWAHAWNDCRVEGLVPSFGGGRPPKPSPGQFADLWKTLEAEQPWTPQEIRQLIHDRYGVEYHPSHLSRLLHRAGMTYSKPRPKDPRQPSNAEKIFAERLGCSNRTALTRLRELAEEGHLTQRKVGTVNLWSVAESRANGE